MQIVADTTAGDGLGDVRVLQTPTDAPSALTYALEPARPTRLRPRTTIPCYYAPEFFRDAHGPNETSLGVNPMTGSAFFQMSRDTAKVTFDDSVSPPAANWQDVTYLLTGQQTLDPYLYTDPATGRTFVTQLLGEHSVTAFSDDDGATWTPTQLQTAAPSFDHESIGAGPYAGAGVPTNTYNRALYYCAQGLLVGQCSRSDDGGITWGPPLLFQWLDACQPSHGRVTVDSTGVVYLPVRDCGANGQGIFMSRDNGVLWEYKFIPNTIAGKSDPALGIDKAGKIYYAATSGGSLVVSTSADHGATWGQPVDVGALVGMEQSEFAMAVGGDDGRAAVAWYGSQTPGDDQDVEYTGEWHLYVGTTLDGGQTWTVQNITGNDPVQRGTICMAGLSCTFGRNLLDFQGMTVAPDGRVLIGFADGCTSPQCVAAEGATNADADSNDSHGAIARQNTGPRLYATTSP